MNKYTNYISKALNTLYYYIRYGDIGVPLNTWIQLRFGHVLHRNFGDELNYYLLMELTDQHFSNITDIVRSSYKNKTDYEIIGSLVDVLTTPNTIVWGSGAIKGNQPLPNKPMKVLAVRGKLTREYLLSQGVECPEVYGDPALLLPYVYKSQAEKKHKIGLIPHVSELDNPILQKAINRLDAHVIRFDVYDDWKSVIDDINSCEYILSSSLHGLILSDAYGIPNIWIKITDKLIGGDLKFRDYFSSVDRDTKSVNLDSITNLSDVIGTKDLNRRIVFNPEPLIKSFPFKLKDNVNIS